MSATMARPGAQVQLEQSDIHLALNLVKMVKERFSHTAIEETKYLIKKPRTEVQEVKKGIVEFPGNKHVKATIQRHPSMLCYNQTSGCLPCQNGTEMNPQKRCRPQGTGAPPPGRPREQIAEPTPPPPPSMPSAPTGNTSQAQPSEILNSPAGYTYSQTAISSVEIIEDDEDTKHDTDIDPDLLTDEG
jgi:hypothetical protein